MSDKEILKPITSPEVEIPAATVTTEQPPLELKDEGQSQVMQSKAGPSSVLHSVKEEDEATTSSSSDDSSSSSSEVDPIESERAYWKALGEAEYLIPMETILRRSHEKTKREALAAIAAAELSPGEHARGLEFPFEEFLGPLEERNEKIALEAREEDTLIREADARDMEERTRALGVVIKPKRRGRSRSD